ncbi:MAG: hypothetical protein EOM19_04575 [Candidatus Moranbacteria bacterium]|nr:hypothetical protein [Candidatus Moranbacteria bacterium]
MKKTLSLKIQKNIIASFLYFDTLDISPTALQLWRMCLDMGKIRGEVAHQMRPREASLRDVIFFLDDWEKKGVILCENGSYILTKKYERFAKRRLSIKYSDEKRVRIKKWIALFRYIPFIRAIILTGGVASQCADKKSDWDVLIITAPRRIWTARALMAFCTHFFGKRRYGIYTKDRFCLNHFITETSLDMRTRDVYSAKEYAFALPLCNQKLFEEFIKNNLWMRSFFPFWEMSRTQPIQCLSQGKYGEKIQRFFERLLSWDALEDILRLWQKKKIQKNPKTRLPGSYIVAEDEALIFLPKPHGPKVFEKFKRSIFEYEQEKRFQR